MNKLLLVFVTSMFVCCSDSNFVRFEDVKVLNNSVIKGRVKHRFGADSGAGDIGDITIKVYYYNNNKLIHTRIVVVTGSCALKAGDIKTFNIKLYPPKETVRIAWKLDNAIMCYF